MTVDRHGMSHRPRGGVGAGQYDGKASIGGDDDLDEAQYEAMLDDWDPDMGAPPTQSWANALPDEAGRLLRSDRRDDINRAFSMMTDGQIVDLIGSDRWDHWRDACMDDVRERVAERAASMPDDMVLTRQWETLTADPSLRVRLDAARSPHLPSHVAERWAEREPDANVLRELADRNDPYVAHAVLKRGETSSSYIALAHANARDLDEASRSDVLSIRARVAGLPRTGADTLERLSRDDYPLVREKAASNPNATAGMLDRLGADPSPRVRGAVANRLPAEKALNVAYARPAKTAAEREELFSVAEPRVLAALVEDGKPGWALGALRYGLKRSLFDGEQERRFATEGVLQVRRVIAASPLTFPSTLRLMADDPNPDIAAKARKRLGR